MTSIATYSYGLAALAFLFLSVMLMTRWRSRAHATAITIASVASLLWSTSLAWQAATPLALLKPGRNRSRSCAMAPGRPSWSS
ncbi:hypothetical protein LP419_18725 [Massilia sp. H-1]|nr:hypothetical protein LP419_18725 [Massilia sp. H-1]